jgi:phosphatidyl-myo-inositol dimannoside synthase
MKICLFTHDMDKGRERLMPWITLVEVAKVMNVQEGIEAVILSSSEVKGINKREFQNIPIIEFPKGNISLINHFLESPFDIIYYPVAWRDGFKSIQFLSELKCKKIAYIPGGVYSFTGVSSLLFTAGFSIAKPYILELIIPKYFITKKLLKAGFSKIITFSNYTGLFAKNSGWREAEVIVALPGKDSFNFLQNDDLFLNKYGLLNRKFYLFMGAPAEIRGSIQLLKAFDEYAEQNSDALLVYLMRTDNHSNYSNFEIALNGIKNRSQILVIKDKLSPVQLKPFVESARAVILPFLLIPSEIPLTYFEVLSCGTPIITYKNGGTYDYVKSAVLACKSGDVLGLSKMMETLWKNDKLHSELSKSALKLMTNHPEWDEIGKKWIKAI